MEKMAKEMQGTTMPVHLIIHQVLGSGFNLKDTEALTEPGKEEEEKKAEKEKEEEEAAEEEESGFFFKI